MNVVRGTLAVGLFAAAIGAFAACSQDQETGESGEFSPTATTVEVRGVIRQLPRHAAVPLLIEHEAIPDFIDIDGNPAPMDSMTMPFAVADEELLSGLEVADPVSFALEIDWQATPAIVITAIEKLPADTALDFGASGDTQTAPGEASPVP